MVGLLWLPPPPLLRLPVVDVYQIAHPIKILHCHQVWPGDADYAGIDIFRLDDGGKIVEHWDVLQVLPEHSNNPNGLF